MVDCDILVDKNIHIDDFNAPQLGHLYFLTHAHSKHTLGLSRSWKYPIYMTSVTKAVVVSRLHIRAELIQVLEVNCPYLINAEGGQICITAIDANHCPGAVMYLFEGNSCTVLHTGDFRYEPTMITNSVLRKKNIDCVYLDVTYGEPKYCFASREAAIKEIINEIECRPAAVIKIALKSLLSHAMLYIKLTQAFQYKLYISKVGMRLMKIVNLSHLFTEDPHRSRIHIIEWRNFTKPNVRHWLVKQAKRQKFIIAATASGFNLTTPKYEDKQCSSMNIDPSQSVIYIPYSDHSSYPELCAFISHINPRSFICIGKDGPPHWYEKEKYMEYDRFNSFTVFLPLTLPNVCNLKLHDGHSFYQYAKNKDRPTHPAVSYHRTSASHLASSQKWPAPATTSASQTRASDVFIRLAPGTKRPHALTIGTFFKTSRKLKRLKS